MEHSVPGCFCNGWLRAGLAPGSRAERSSVGLCRVLGWGQLSLRQAVGSVGLEALEGWARKLSSSSGREAPLSSPSRQQGPASS